MKLSSRDNNLIVTYRNEIDNLDFMNIENSQDKARLCRLLARADLYPFSALKDLSKEDWEDYFVDVPTKIATSFDPLWDGELEIDPIRINAMLKIMYILGYGIWTIKGIDLSSSSISRFISDKYAITRSRNDRTPGGYFNQLFKEDSKHDSLTPAMFGLEGDTYSDWDGKVDSVYSNWNDYATKVNYTK